MSAEIEPDSERVNLVPLIDCMFFLILFFMLAMRFGPTELQLTALLPTEGGAGAIGPQDPLAAEQINLAICPSGLDRGMDVRACEALVRERHASGAFGRSAALRIGGSQPLLIEGAPLALGDGPETAALAHAQLAAFHDYVAANLRQRERPGLARRDQHPIVISCFSGLPWKYGILAYDAVRAYEQERMTAEELAAVAHDPQQARAVSFAPPRIRNVPHETGHELWELLRLL